MMIKRRKQLVHVPNVVVKSEKSGETKFDSTAESKIIVVTDENSDEVSVHYHSTLMW